MVKIISQKKLLEQKMDKSKAIIGTVLTVKRYCRLLIVLLPLGHANEIEHFLSARKIHRQAKDMTMSHLPHFLQYFGKELMELLPTTVSPIVHFFYSL